MQLTKLEQAVVVLSEHCDGAAAKDGAGYNAFDAPFMNSLAEQLTCSAPKSLSPKQQAIAYERLEKYAVQLLDNGIDYTLLPVPGLAGHTARMPGQPPTWIDPSSSAASPPTVIVDRSMGRAAGVMVARMPGVCEACNGIVTVGSEFTWGQERGARVHHPQCPTAASVVVPTQLRSVQRVPQAGLKVRDGLTVDDIIGPHGMAAKQLPGYEHRPQQLGGARLAQQALDEADVSIIEAGTGTGKSLMAMAAAAAHRINGGRPSIIVTADKALQAQYRDKDAPFLTRLLQEAGYTWRAAELKGRQNYLCLQDYHERLQESQLLGEPTWRNAEAAAGWPLVLEWMRTPGISGDFEQATVEIPAATRSELSRGRDTCIGQKCDHFAACFAQVARKNAKRADAVIANLALFGKHMQIMDQTGGDARVIPIGLDDTRDDHPLDDDPDAEVTTPGATQPVVILDEAHELEEAASEAFGVELRLGRWYGLADQVQRLTVFHKEYKAALRKDTEEATRLVHTAQDWYDRAGVLAKGAARVWTTWGERLAATEEGAMRLGDEVPVAGPLQVDTDKMGVAMEDGTPPWLQDKQAAQWARVAKAYKVLALEFAQAITPSEDDNWVRYAQQEVSEEDGEVRRTVVVQAKPVDPAELLRANLWDMYPAVVALSATLTSTNGLDYWRERVGAPNNTLDMVVPAPFNYASQAQVYLPANGKLLDPRGARDLTGATGRHYLANLCVELYQLVDAANGGAFLLFTSRRMLNAVAAQLGEELGARWTVLVQGQAPRPELVRQFKEDGNAVLLGLKSFWQGVDVPGEALRLVAINAMPFNPPTDPVWGAKCDRVDRQAGRPGASFRRLGLPTATIALKQGFGRLIRSMQDFGVVALLDGRLTTEWYGQQVLAALPPATQVRSIAAVRAFYATQAVHTV